MWNLILSDEETMIVDAVREFLAAELPLERLRPDASRADPIALRKNIARLGWFGVGLPEALGGSGLGLVEELLIQREFGRSLASPSTLAGVLAGHICTAAGDSDLAKNVSSGQHAVCLALVHDHAATARVSVFDWQDGSLVVAWNREGMGLFAAEALGKMEQEACIDDSLTMHVGQLAQRSALHWVPSNSSPLLMRAQVMLAAALTGLAEQASKLTVEYARVREQFGKPIGTFQAVKHRCADMGVRARLAWYQTSLACLKVQAGAADAAFQVSCALLVAFDAAHENGRAAIQLHGGIGFQAECDVHWFMKRAHVYEQLAGGRSTVAKSALARFAKTGQSDHATL